MKTLRHVKTRRDRCHLIACRALRLNEAQAARAWNCLAVKLEELAEKDTPKFRDLLGAIHLAAANGKKP